MRILQIIDSLEAGGAEQMAVSYANALVDKIEFSGLVATRAEGVLRKKLSSRVSYLFLNKIAILDFKALFKLRKWVIENRISHIQAHSSSFFTAFLLKMVLPQLRLIWHDHYGNSEYLDKRSIFELKLTLPFFGGIIAVNQKLKVWAAKNKLSQNVIYLPNFPSKSEVETPPTILNGIEGKRIVCLANLRPQKDHFFLLEVACKIKKTHPEWSFHLVGKDFQDAYSQEIKEKLMELNLEKTVFMYGSKNDVDAILNQSTIAILSSQSEGLPVSLLEYGMQKMPVVVTNVGEISSLVQHTVNGFLVPSKDSKFFCEALIQLIENNDLRKKMGFALYEELNSAYSEATIIQKYLVWLKSLK
jgi:glycosyltransferase involved in cell wall biosynthesis